MSSRISSTRLCLSVLAVLLCFAVPVRADVSIESVDVGIGQVTRPGVWTRLQVQLQATEAVDCRVEVIAADPTGNPATFPSAALKLQPGTSRRVSLFFMPGRLEETITVRVVSAEGIVLASKKLNGAESKSDAADFVVVRHTVPIWVVAGTLGSDRSGKSDHQATQQAIADRGVQLTQLESTSKFPDQWRALSAVSVVFLSGRFDLTEEQSSALNQWVRSGGHVVVIAGTRVEELTSSPIARWALDGSEMTASSLSDLSGLEAYAKSSFRIPIAARIKGSIIRARDGVDVVTGIEGPLLTRSSHGFGRITILGVDLDRPPLSRWRALDSFVAAIADLPPTKLTDESAGQRISHTGVTEMATQFQIGMETIPDVGDRSTLTVLGLVLLFLLIIGPLDYFLVHRLLKKPGLTWLTFPAIVVGAGLLAGAVAGGANGTVVRSRMCELLDLDADSGFSRHTVWSTIYSPVHRRYRVQINHDLQMLSPGRSASPSAADAPGAPEASSSGWLHWFAAPESNFGGMYRAAGLNLGGAGYRFSEDRSEIANLPIPAASDRILASTTTFDVSSKLFDLNLKQAGTGHLSRDSTFTHHLPFPIDDWVLVYGNRVYFHDYLAGDLMGSSAIEPEVVWSAIGRTTGGRELRSFLTGSTFQQTGRKGVGGSGDEFEHTQVDWNRRETDLQAILRMVTFYELAGGRDYTGLLHDTFSDLEMSDSLPLDRAVLFGRLSTPGATIQIDGQALPPDRQESFIRVLLRVEDAPIESSLPLFDK
ncbi:MAG: hypothetical protein HQ518_20075 [Rhodopirellula sp.]|nr:hypothetical protein [Rhodopirellula sp.]